MRVEKCGLDVVVGLWWSDAVGGARFGSGDLRTADMHERSRMRQGDNFRSAMSFIMPQV